MTKPNARFRSKSIVARVPAALAGIALAGITTLAATSLRGQDKEQRNASRDKEFSVTVQGSETDAGLLVSARATAKEVGLPIYPGSIPTRGQDKNSPAAKLGLWGASFGFKLVVLQMESKDSPRKVAEYYQKALAKYGPVLDCASAVPAKEAKDESSGKLTCGDDKLEPGQMLFKAGTKEKQHLVEVQSKGTGAVFKLLYIEVRGEKEPA
jgi:hypothetical protein